MTFLREFNLQIESGAESWAHGSVTRSVCRWSFQIARNGIASKGSRRTCATLGSWGAPKCSRRGRRKIRDPRPCLVDKGEKPIPLGQFSKAFGYQS